MKATFEHSPMAMAIVAALACCLTPAVAQNLAALQRQLGLYGTPQQCQTRTRFVQRVDTTTVVQPIDVAQTRTMVANMVATATVAVTSTMQRVEQRQVTVPVLRTFEQTTFQTRTQVQQVPFQPNPQTSVVVRTVQRVQTRVNNQVVTNTQTSVRPVFVTRTQFNTQFATRFNTETRFETRQVRQRDVESTNVQTQFVTRTERINQPAFTSNVQTRIVQTSQAIRFVTPRPFTRTRNVQREVVSTQFQQVVNTQQAVATREVTRTRFVQVTSTRVQFDVRTTVRNQVVVSTQFNNRVVTSTVVIPENIVRTSIFNQVNNRIVTRTVQTTRVQVQTVRGRDDIVQRVQTQFDQRTSVVTNDIQGQAATVYRTVSLGCQQTRQEGYNYDAPSSPFNFAG